MKKVSMCSRNIKNFAGSGGRWRSVAEVGSGGRRSVAEVGGVKKVSMCSRNIKNFAGSQVLFND